ncbi:unnamed protein product [Symbiodinium sp. CCMP2592]|nr:unnamed protein product [Symbiodinium sp. CCMP2592]
MDPVLAFHAASHNYEPMRMDSHLAVSCPQRVHKPTSDATGDPPPASSIPSANSSTLLQALASQNLADILAVMRLDADSCASSAVGSTEKAPGCGVEAHPTNALHPQAVADERERGWQMMSGELENGWDPWNGLVEAQPKPRPKSAPAKPRADPGPSLSPSEASFVVAHRIQQQQIQRGQSWIEEMRREHAEAERKARIAQEKARQLSDQAAHRELRQAIAQAARLEEEPELERSQSLRRKSVSFGGDREPVAEAEAQSEARQPNEAPLRRGSILKSSSFCSRTANYEERLEDARESARANGMQRRHSTCGSVSSEGDLGLPSLSVLRALRKEAEALVKYTQEAKARTQEEKKDKAIREVVERSRCAQEERLHQATIALAETIADIADGRVAPTSSSSKLLLSTAKNGHAEPLEQEQLAQEDRGPAKQDPPMAARNVAVETSQKEAPPSAQPHASRHIDAKKEEQMLMQEERRHSRLQAKQEPLPVSVPVEEASQLEIPSSAQPYNSSTSRHIETKKKKQMLEQEERRPSRLQAKQDPLTVSVPVEEASQLEIPPPEQPCASRHIDAKKDPPVAVGNVSVEASQLEASPSALPHPSAHTGVKKEEQMLAQQEGRPSRFQAKQEPLAVSVPVEEASQLDFPSSAQPYASRHIEAKKRECMLTQEERRPSRLQAVSASAEELETPLSAQPYASRLLAQEERRPSHLQSKQDALASGNIVEEASQLEILPSAQPSASMHTEAKGDEQMLMQEERRPSCLQAKQDPLPVSVPMEEASTAEILRSAQPCASGHTETKKEQIPAQEATLIPPSQAEQDPLVVGDIPLEMATEETPPRRPSMHAVSLGDETSWQATRTSSESRPPQTLLKMSKSIDMLPEPRRTSTPGLAKALDALEAQEEGLADTTGLFRSRPDLQNCDQHRVFRDVQSAKAVRPAVFNEANSVELATSRQAPKSFAAHSGPKKDDVAREKAAERRAPEAVQPTFVTEPDTLHLTSPRQDGRTPCSDGSWQEPDLPEFRPTNSLSTGSRALPASLQRMKPPSTEPSEQRPTRARPRPAQAEDFRGVMPAAQQQPTSESPRVETPEQSAAHTVCSRAMRVFCALASGKASEVHEWDSDDETVEDAGGCLSARGARTQVPDPEEMENAARSMAAAWPLAWAAVASSWASSRFLDLVEAMSPAGKRRLNQHLQSDYVFQDEEQAAKGKALEASLARQQGLVKAAESQAQRCRELLPRPRRLQPPGEPAAMVNQLASPSSSRTSSPSCRPPRAVSPGAAKAMFDVAEENIAYALEDALSTAAEQTSRPSSPAATMFAGIQDPELPTWAESRSLPFASPDLSAATSRENSPPRAHEASSRKPGQRPGRVLLAKKAGRNGKVKPLGAMEASDTDEAPGTQFIKAKSPVVPGRKPRAASKVMKPPFRRPEWPDLGIVSCAPGVDGHPAFCLCWGACDPSRHASVARLELQCIPLDKDEVAVAKHDLGPWDAVETCSGSGKEGRLWRMSFVYASGPSTILAKTERCVQRFPAHVGNGKQPARVYFTGPRQGDALALRLRAWSRKEAAWTPFGSVLVVALADLSGDGNLHGITTSPQLLANIRATAHPGD